MINFFLMVYIGMQLNAPAYYYIILTIDIAYKIYNTVSAIHQKNEQRKETAKIFEKLLEELEESDGDDNEPS